MSWPFFKTRKHYCPDGSVKLVYRNVDDAFPFYVPGWEGKLDAKLKGAPARLRAEYATKIQGLLYGLDELNQGVMFDFRAAYVTYMNDPCQHAGFFERQVEKIIHEQ